MNRGHYRSAREKGGGKGGGARPILVDPERRGHRRPAAERKGSASCGVGPRTEGVGPLYSAPGRTDRGRFRHDYDGRSRQEALRGLSCSRARVCRIKQGDEHGEEDHSCVARCRRVRLGIRRMGPERDRPRKWKMVGPRKLHDTGATTGAGPGCCEETRGRIQGLHEEAWTTSLRSSPAVAGRPGRGCRVCPGPPLGGPAGTERASLNECAL
jgi:hypothetical protein